MTDDTIALCVPAFNAASLLPRLFDSVRRQTVAFDEIWVYDDASTDGTAAIAKELGARVIRGQSNVGCSAGKNALLGQIGAAWVHFHDADDELFPEFVARAKSRMTQQDFDALLFNYEQVDEQTGHQMSRSYFEASGVEVDAVRYLLMHTVNNGGVYAVDLLRRAGGFDLDPAVRYNEDRAFHLRLAEAGARFAVDSYIGSRFYFNPGSMSAANRVKCLLANHEITRRFVARHTQGYSSEVSLIAWHNAAGLASCLEWGAADDCIALALEHGGRIPAEGSLLFRILCLLSPSWALRIRENLIRQLKPRYRVGYPVRREVP